MAQVPRYDNLQTSIGGVRTPQVGMQAGEIAGEQLQRMGGAMSSAGRAAAAIALDVQNQVNDARFRELDADFTDQLTKLQFDPQSGFSNQKGRNALDSLGTYTEQARKALSTAQAAAPNDAVRAMLARTGGDRLESAVGAMRRHASGEFNRYQVEGSDARAQASLQAGALDFRNGPAFDANLNTAITEAFTQGKLQGWGEDLTKLRAQEYADKAYRLRYDAWRVEDPVGALKDFQQRAGSISPAARVQIYHQLFEGAAPSLALQINQAGGVGVIAPDAGSTGSDAPRGIRNNNPGNIIRTATAWQGEVQGTDPRYSSFESPEAGIRAMGKTLLTYQDQHGLKTVADIVARWAPASENNTAAYTKTVAAALGVKPDQEINLRDTKTLQALTKAIIKVENGTQPYTDQQIALGVAAATDGTALQAGAGRGFVNPGAPASGTSSSAPAAAAWRDPNVPTGNAIVDGLPSDWKLHVLTMARAQAHQDMAAERDALRAKVQDASASYMANGFAPSPPALAEFIRAYGQAEGQAQYASFQGVVKLGQQLQQVRTLPAAQLDDLVRQSKPAPGPGFAEAQRNHEILTRAVATVSEARAKDPIQYAALTNSYGVKPIARLDDPKAVAKALTQRAGVVGQISSDYGTAPTLLAEGEARALSDALKGMPVELQKHYLGALAGAVPDMNLVKLTMQSIAPDQPVLAMAGVYQARGLRTTEGRDVADLMLRGQAILTPNRKTDGSAHQGGASLIKMPEAKLMLSDFNAATGDAFKGKEQAADLFMQASRAIYAAKSAEAGDYSGNLDSSRWRASINLATGGIQSHNGASIVMPYGMGYDAFQDQLRTRAEALAKTVQAATLDEMTRLPLENVGDGRYLFRRGAGYLVDKDGRPVVIDMNPRQAVPTSAAPMPAATPMPRKVTPPIPAAGPWPVTAQ